MAFVYDYDVEVREQGVLLKTFRVENVAEGKVAINIAEQGILAWNKDIEVRKFYIVEGKEKNGDAILREVLWTGLDFFARRITALDGRDLAMV